MAIIKPQSLTENSREQVMQFLNCNAEISKEELSEDIVALIDELLIYPDFKTMIH